MLKVESTKEELYDYYRYPDERTIYNKIVGDTRVDNIVDILTGFGFNVVTKESENDDVDIWVYKDGVPVLVVEVTNWRQSSYMDFNRAESIRMNFSKYNNTVRKLLVVSFANNYMHRASHFNGLDMDVLEVGFQTQPMDYYEFYKRKGMAGDMQPDNLETMEILRGKLEAYLKKKRLI